LEAGEPPRSMRDMPADTGARPAISKQPNTGRNRFANPRNGSVFDTVREA
jgi:hypothetical protein